MSNSEKLLKQENMILKRAIRTLWKDLEYSREYISFLQGYYTKQQFDKITKKFIDRWDNPKIDISFASELLENVIGRDLSETDLALLLNINPLNISEYFYEDQVKNQ